MRRVEPRIPCALLVSPQSLPKWPEVRETALRLGLQGVSVFHARIDERTALDCQRCGLALFTWTPDENADIGALARHRGRRRLHQLPRSSRRLARRHLAGPRATHPDPGSGCYTELAAQGRSSAGRAAVSKTAGRGFESLRPCQTSISEISPLEGRVFARR